MVKIYFVKIYFPTRTKLLNITMNRINHSVYLCSTRHLMLHRSLSHVKCCFVDVEKVQHSGRQSSTSTIYLLGILPEDFLSDNTTSRAGGRKKLVLNICDNTFVRFGIDERLHKIFILFPKVFNSGNFFSFPFRTLAYKKTLLLI